MNSPVRAVLAQHRTDLLARERREGARDVDARRAHNAALRGGAVPTIRASDWTISAVQGASDITAMTMLDTVYVKRPVYVYEVEVRRADGRTERLALKVNTDSRARADTQTEAEMQHAVHTDLKLAAAKDADNAGAAPMAQALEVHAIVDGPRYVGFLMPYAMPCPAPADQSCYLTLDSAVRGLADGFAFFDMLLRVFRALKHLNRGENVFVHGDLHAKNVMVKVRGGRTKPLRGDDVEDVMLIDTGMSYVKRAGRELGPLMHDWATRCHGDDAANRPKPSRDIVTLWLSLLPIIPPAFASTHALMKTLVILMQAQTRLGDDKGILKLNTCANGLVPGGKMLRKGDFVYKESPTGGSSILDAEGKRMRGHLHYVAYANTLNIPSKSPFATPGQMCDQLERDREELKTRRGMPAKPQPQPKQSQPQPQATSDPLIGDPRLKEVERVQKLRKEEAAARKKREAAARKKREAQQQQQQPAKQKRARVRGQPPPPQAVGNPEERKRKQEARAKKAEDDERKQREAAAKRAASVMRSPETSPPSAKKPRTNGKSGSGSRGNPIDLSSSDSE